MSVYIEKVINLSYSNVGDGDKRLGVLIHMRGNLQRQKRVNNKTCNRLQLARTMPIARTKKDKKDLNIPEYRTSKLVC